MAAYDRIPSGLSGLDEIVDNIRLGDNVVWQLGDIKDYRRFTEPFVESAVKAGRNIIYLRFAAHPPVINGTEGVKVYNLDINSGFESFTVEVHNIIAKEGREAFYVFDCLSELQTAWAADLMMGNFFTVTCPYLFELDTVAYFAILRNRHSFDTIARIRDTTQLLIDVHTDGKKLYVHPIKVWRRYSTTMFLPHVFENDVMEPLTDGIETSRFFSAVSRQGMNRSGHKLDYWDRIFLEAEKLMEETEGMDPKAAERTEMVEKLCKLVIGREKSMLELAVNYFDLLDLIKIKERMTGSGYIGGKAVGMLLARKMLKELDQAMEPHDSFYIGSDVFYTFIVQNGWWKQRLEQRTDEGYFRAAKQLKNRISGGIFPDIIREQFRSVLEYFGQNPIIVRSSSLLEDGFGNAFAGKYESIFLVNSGSLEERLSKFESAIKRVYASSMDESALVYRKQRGLDKSDEQMAVLVQRVSGSWFGGMFMPGCAGVAYSYNTYAWSKDMDAKAGMARLVLGLGTRAVDRTEGDYPRIVSLDKPNLRLLSKVGDKSRFSQHYADLLDVKAGSLKSMEINDIKDLLPPYLKQLMLEHDTEGEAYLAQRGIREERMLATCSGLIENTGFTALMKDMLSRLENMYGYPVDIEFTINFSSKGEFAINLLQCRPLQVKGLGLKIAIPEVDRGKIVFSLGETTMGGSIYQNIEKIIMVDPAGYSMADASTKYKVARTVGKLNSLYGKDSSGLMLIGPGRWGTTTPELGVPVRFAEICNFKVLCELAFESAGFIPELSYGSHFFQDLVEADIFYAAIFPGSEETVFSPEVLKDCETRLSEVLPDAGGLDGIIKVYDTREAGLTLISELSEGRTLLYRA